MQVPATLVALKQATKALDEAVKNKATAEEIEALEVARAAAATEHALFLAASI